MLTFKQSASDVRSGLFSFSGLLTSLSLRGAKMLRMILWDDQRMRNEKLLQRKAGDLIRRGADDRLFLKQAYGWRG